MTRPAAPAALLAAALALAAAPALAGVGFAWRGVTDPVSGLRAPVALWYHSAAEGGETRVGPIAFPATENAAPASARALVVLSHGAGGSALGHHDTAVALAAAGYLVAAPLHPRDNFEDGSGSGGREVLTGRVATLSAVIDAVAAEGLAPTGRVGVLGHSTGGYTALVLAGAEASFAALRANCDRASDDASCAYWPPARTVAEGDAPIAADPDPRVAVVVLFAPLVSPFPDAALAGLDLPMQVWQAREDGVLTPPHHAARLADRAAEFVAVPDANHGAFLAVLPPGIEAGAPPWLRTPPGFDKPAFHEALNARVAAFLDEHLTDGSE